jgi:hypothetical protein
LFLSRSNPEDVPNRLTALNLTQKDITDQSGLLGLLAQHVGDPEFGEKPSIRSFDVLCDFGTGLSNSLGRAWSVVFKTITKSVKRIECLASDICDAVNKAAERRGPEQLDKKMERTISLWQRLWRCMTVDRAPWSLRKGTSREWTRNPILC